MHLKTAGTSYSRLSAPSRRWTPCFSRRSTNLAWSITNRINSAIVSARLDRAPSPQEHATPNNYLENFDAREILVTFGSVLKQKNPDGTWRFYDRLITLLNQNPEAYASNLERHFVRHLNFLPGRKGTTNKTKQRVK